MAVTISTALTPTRTTLSATPDVATKFTLPRNARRIIVQFITNAGKIAWTGTDAVAIGSSYLTVVSNTPYVFTIGGGMGNRKIDETATAIYLASGTASTVVEIIVEF